MQWTARGESEHGARADMTARAWRRALVGHERDVAQAMSEARRERYMALAQSLLRPKAPRRRPARAGGCIGNPFDAPRMCGSGKKNMASLLRAQSPSRA